MCEDINTLVVVDLETNGFPSEQFNSCSITEITLFAFSAKCLTERACVRNVNNLEDEAEFVYPTPPQLPRVLHKLSLMINPMRMINPSAERVTGLSNEMLENETPFDAETAKCINLFLERLQQPVCMVAHNGWFFDYPIIRYVYEKLKMSLPSSIYCVDSLNAFRELDEKSEQRDKEKEILRIIESEVEQIDCDQNTIDLSDSTIISDPLEENSNINWKLNNETTPQRKQPSSSSNHKNFQHTPPAKRRSVSLSVRRSLFADSFKPKTKYPPKGVYKLGNIYKRCFNQDPLNLHRAESDVEILTKLVLHYGLDFLAYAEERKQPFINVPKLGSPY